MPDVADVIQIALAFEGVEGGVITNIFTSQLLRVAVDSWSAVADDVENFFADLYDDWLENVSDDVKSTGFVISKRDADANQWNEVISRDFLGLDGKSPAESLPSLNAATIVAFPAVARHWGFKNMPAPSEDAVSGGNLTLGALADLVFSSVVYSTPYFGADTDWGNGVYSLATEQYRGFQPSVLITSIVGSRVTRKEGRGI